MVSIHALDVQQMADCLKSSCTKEEVLGSEVLILPPSGGRSAIVLDTRVSCKVERCKDRRGLDRGRMNVPANILERSA